MENSCKINTLTKSNVLNNCYYNKNDFKFYLQSLMAESCFTVWLTCLSVA
jgi:hypothetical protein